jgi:hypothetical protein
MLRRGNVLLFSVAAFVILAAVFIAKPGVSLHNRTAVTYTQLQDHQTG